MQIYTIEIKDLIEYDSFVKANADLIPSYFLTEQESSVSKLMYIACAYVLKNKYGVVSPIQLCRTHHGKPHLKESAIELSFTHSATHIAFAISSAPNGTDMEKIRKLPIPLLRYFHNNYLTKSTEKNEAINQMIYWTGLEALGKLIQVCVYDLLQQASVDDIHLQYKDQYYVKKSFLIADSNILSVVGLDNSDSFIQFYNIEQDETHSALIISPFTPVNI